MLNALNAALTDAGVPDALANIPTMPPALVAAILKESGESLSDIMKDIFDLLIKCKE